MSYVDSEDFKATLGISNTDFADDDIDRAIDAAGGIVDDICGRSFTVPSEDETRYFAPESATLLRIDDLVSATSVSVDRDNDGTYEETWTQGTEYRLGHPNAAVRGEPFTYLETMPGYSLPINGGYVKIAGMFGWATVPAGVVQATGLMANRLLKRSREAPFAILLAGEMGAARIGRVDPEVRALLTRYTSKPSIASPRLG